MMKNELSSRLRKRFPSFCAARRVKGFKRLNTFSPRHLKLSGYHVFSAEEYMSRIRGEVIQRLIRVSSNRVSAPVDRIDLLIPFSPGAISHVQKRISPKTILLGEKKIYENEYQGEKAIDVPLSQIASGGGRPHLFEYRRCSVACRTSEGGKGNSRSLPQALFCREGREYHPQKSRGGEKRIRSER